MKTLAIKVKNLASFTNKPLNINILESKHQGDLANYHFGRAHFHRNAQYGAKEHSNVRFHRDLADDHYAKGMTHKKGMTHHVLVNGEVMLNKQKVS